MEVGEGEKEVPEKLVVPAIQYSIPSTDHADYRTVTQRYYTPLYHLDPDRARGEDLLVLCHSNKICLIALAPSHPVIRRRLAVTRVNLDVSKNIDRKSNKTSGKSKKGGQALQKDSVLAILETEGRSYKVAAVVPGKLICMNKVISEDPGKLITHHDSLGHVAIVLPTKGQYDHVRAALATQEDYDQKIREEELEEGREEEAVS